MRGNQGRKETRKHQRRQQTRAENVRRSHAVRPRNPALLQRSGNAHALERSVLSIIEETPLARRHLAEKAYDAFHVQKRCVFRLDQEPLRGAIVHHPAVAQKLDLRLVRRSAPNVNHPHVLVLRTLPRQHLPLHALPLSHDEHHAQGMVIQTLSRSPRLANRLALQRMLRLRPHHYQNVRSLLARAGRKKDLCGVSIRECVRSRRGSKRKRSVQLPDRVRLKMLVVQQAVRFRKDTLRNGNGSILLQRLYNSMERKAITC